ncbi:MAG: VanW family protein [Clostridiales bacterium]|nr:VanW family protein [Clostridiales bacterium]
MRGTKPDAKASGGGFLPGGSGAAAFSPFADTFDNSDFAAFAPVSDVGGSGRAFADAEAGGTRARVEIVYNGRVFYYADEFITATDHTVEETIFNRKINSPLPDKLRLVEKCLTAGASYKDAVLYCFPLIAGTVSAAVAYIDRAPVDSVIKFNPDKTPMFEITRESVGYEMAENRLYQEIYLALKRGPDARIAAIPKVLQPSVTAYDNMKLTKLRARFTTDYASSVENRKHNIRLALKKINGTVLMPGKEFSFNGAVGPRTVKNGFKEAKIIMSGEYVEGVGGGVCQASTTLYNCAVLSGLEVTAVNNHSLACGYVGPSFDAMVNASWSDLKFKCGADTPVFIRAYGTVATAVVEIYGAPLPYTITTQSVIVSKADPPADREIIDVERKYVAPASRPGDKLRVSYGHGAMKSEGYLLYHDKSGKLIDKKLIRRDSYSPIAGIIAVTPLDALSSAADQTEQPAAPF